VLLGQCLWLAGAWALNSAVKVGAASAGLPSLRSSCLHGIGMLAVRGTAAVLAVLLADAVIASFR
jgi:hypothetical protein